MKIQHNRVLVFDTNIFLLGFDFNVIPGKIYTVPGVLDEIMVERYENKNRTILTRIHYAKDIKKLILKEPREEYINEVKEKATITNDLKVLSGVDIKLIALTLELQDTSKKPVILYTNDYSMENVCSELLIAYSPLKRKGIQKKIFFEFFCPFCNERKEVTEDICERCGTKIKRRPKSLKNNRST
ncbi:MAG: Endoribonuclease Nob1 [Promethearchaeota archaeon]|nr:MAG: Endoribonuclease Nob1 [Candidatus Lokiarchaeota archaeon]